MDLQYVSAYWLSLLIDLSLSYKVRRNCEASRERFKQVPVHQSGACRRLGLIGRAKINNGKTTVSPGPSARFGRDNLRGPIMRTHVSFIPDAPYLHPDCIPPNTIH